MYDLPCDSCLLTKQYGDIGNPEPGMGRKDAASILGFRAPQGRAMGGPSLVGNLLLGISYGHRNAMELELHGIALVSCPCQASPTSV